MRTAVYYINVKWGMKILVVAFILSCFHCLGAEAQVTYDRKDSLTVCRILKQAGRQTTMLDLARQFIGVPYVAHTLEVNEDEQLVVNTRELDCTTLVETVAALKLCAQKGKKGWTDYIEAIRMLRYRGGVINGYPSRLHYFSDWIADKHKMKLVADIQGPNPPYTSVQTIKVNYMSEHPKAYKALRKNPELVEKIRLQEKLLTGQKVRYIPKDAIQNTTLMRQTVKDGDILAITCTKAGLDIAHLGFAVWRSDGLHLLNASQIRRQVVEEPMSLRYYLRKHPTFTGIRVVRLMP